MKKLLLLLICILPLNLFAVYWTTQYSGTVYDISFPDSLHGWAALGKTTDYKGRVLSTKDGGKTWTVKNIGSVSDTIELTSICFTDSLNGWAGGRWWSENIPGYLTCYEWIVMQTKNGFNTYYTKQEGYIPSNVHVWGGVMRMETADDSLFWSYYDYDESYYRAYFSDGKHKYEGEISSICFLDYLHGWVVYSYNFSPKTLLKTTTGVSNLSFSYSLATGINDIDFIDTLHGWAVGDTGKILYTNNGGVDSLWDTLTSGVTNKLTCVKFVDSLNGWAGGDGILLRTRDGGQTWVTEYSGTVSKICAIDTTYAWALSGGNILKYHPYVGVEENNAKHLMPNAELKIIKNKIYLSVPNNPPTADFASLNNGESKVSLTIYDLCGRLKEVIYSGTLNKGAYTFVSHIESNGIYFVNLSTGTHRETQKLILIK
ncbi:MAG: YCF48-related protein [bacterium]|nr:YCF48-related protein [bacterium]